MEITFSMNPGSQTAEVLEKLKNYIGDSRVSYDSRSWKIKIFIPAGFCSIPHVFATIAEILETSRIGV